MSQEEIDKKLSLILTRLGTLEDQNKKLEAENAALKQQVEASKPLSPIDQAIALARKQAEDQQNIDTIRKNYPIGSIVLQCLKKDLIKRTDIE